MKDNKKHTCFNHPNNIAHNKCGVCGIYYCDACLNEGLEYYYCNKKECLDSIYSKELPTQINCPSCNEELELDQNERIEKKFHCPICEKFIDYTSDPPKILGPKEYVHVLTSLNQGDIAVIKSVLENENIEYYIYGENFLSVDPLIQGARLYVYKKHLNNAKELLKELKIHILGASKRINS